jgi:hypothetical protein
VFLITVTLTFSFAAIRITTYMYGRTYVCTAEGCAMKRKVTLVFHDEDLYTQLKIEAVRRRTTASEIVADAVREWLESHEDAEMLPVIEAARAEWREKGGCPWSEVESKIARSIDRREGTAGGRRV